MGCSYPAHVGRSAIVSRPLLVPSPTVPVVVSPPPLADSRRVRARRALLILPVPIPTDPGPARIEVAAPAARVLGFHVLVLGPALAAQLGHVADLHVLGQQLAI